MLKLKLDINPNTGLYHSQDSHSVTKPHSLNDKNSNFLKGLKLSHSVTQQDTFEIHYQFERIFI